jgi:hypothetical protein
MSLGGIIDGVTTAIEPTFETTLLNVPAVGWADIFENTDNLDIRCGVVDGLIASGTIMGTPRDTMGTATTTDDTGTCVGTEWKMQPGYRRFAAIGRWVLDPADPGNFAATARTKRHLIQEVMGDTVVPNYATDIMGMLYGNSPENAKTNTTGPSTTPTPAVAMMANKWIRYANVAPNLGMGFPGNTYNHVSILRPATSVNATAPTDACTGGTPQFCDGVFGTAQMVTDAVTWLQTNR